MKTQKAFTNGHRTTSSGHSTPVGAMTRNLTEVLFRRRWQILISFIGIFVVVASISLFWGHRYKSSMMILVSQNERADAPATGQPNVQPVGDRNGVTVEELNSEVALLRSDDLLRRVVVECGLNRSPQPFWRKVLHLNSNGLTPQERTAEAVRTLADRLTVEVLPMSDMIEVSYDSANPQLAARVLNVLAQLYMKKHVAVHRPQDVLAFFQQQTKRFGTALAADESKLVGYTQNAGVVSAPTEMNAALQQISQFESMKDETGADSVGTEHQIAELQKELTAMHPRVTTAIKTSDDAQLIQNLKSTLLNLELQRTQLLEKYQPSYRPVREVEQEIAQTRGAIAAAEKAPWQEVTTDRDPTFELVLGDLTKARADLADDQAREAALGRVIGGLRTRAVWLQQQGVVQDNLMRNFQTAEANYTLYLNKAEEARISDALDSRQILNVALAQAPTAPVLPVHSSLWYLGLSGFISGLAALGLAIVTDNLDPTVRSPKEVEALLNLPVLGLVPREKNGKNGNGHHPSGNGHGNGHGRIETHVS